MPGMPWHAPCASPYGVRKLYIRCRLQCLAHSKSSRTLIASQAGHTSKIARPCWKTAMPACCPAGNVNLCRAAHVAVRLKRGRRCVPKHTAFKMKAANKQILVAFRLMHTQISSCSSPAHVLSLPSSSHLRLCHSHSVQPLILGCSSALSNEVVSCC